MVSSNCESAWVDGRSREKRVQAPHQLAAKSNEGQSTN